MMPLRSLCFSLAAALLLGAAPGLLADTPSVPADTVSISGAVLQPGSYQWHADARLRDVTVAGQVRADAWFLGAALLRESALEPQQRLKAGVLFDLRVNKLHARVNNDTPLLELTERLESLVEPLPVTARVPAQLNPFQLMIPENNPLLEPGDHLIYPSRPSQVRVMGAVNQTCELPFDAELALKDYLRQCPAHPVADRSFVHVIQPDGQVQHIGIAHWNEQPVNIAVGAIIYRPLNPARTSPETADMNQDMAALLATQYQLGGRFNE